MAIKVAIVGSRGFSDLARVQQAVASLKQFDPQITIVSGGAKGVDKAAEDAARYLKLNTVIFPAEWHKHGKQAGMVRNKLIVNEADHVIAFWDGKSKGTKNTIDLALKNKKNLEVVFE